MKFFLMILVAMVALMCGCSFDYKPPSKTSDEAGDTLADSRDADDGEVGDETNFNPPLTETDGPQLTDTFDTGLDTNALDTETAHDDGQGEDEKSTPETDALPDGVSETAEAETNPPMDTVNTDTTNGDEINDALDMADTDGPNSTDTSADGDSSGDTNDSGITEPKADTSDAQNAEAEVTLPCIPNCANKQCGDNGCDGSCGACLDGYACTTDFICECVVGCQIPAEPTVDAADAIDTDAGADTTADAKAETLPAIDAADTTDALPDETGTPSAETVIIVEPSADANVVEIAAETVNEDTATMAETTPNADTAAEAGAETGEDTVGEPDIFVQPCLVDPLLCDDGNACTDDSCDTVNGCVHTNNTAPCDDGNQCTVNDACGNSVCVPGMPIVCDDNVSCTDDYCQNGVGCVYEWACECVSDSQCDDLNPCTDDSCISGFCEYPFNSTACDDNNACTITDQCVEGECLGIALLNCDDENQCTIDACDPVSGCQHESQTGMACDDGDACTTTDACDKDVCGGKTIVCNDQNPCTDDSCDKQSGCVYAPNNANPCEDGSLCTTGDFCDAGQCQGGKALKCDDENICTDDVCQPQKGCVYPANQAGCDDGNSCTVGDICADMACASGTNICECESDADCANADDDNLCNGTVVCDQLVMPFKCVTDPDTIITCNPAKDTVCFKNTCIPATGDCEMAAVNQGSSCDDGNACTSNDQCANGICAGQSVKCDDSNVCTDDSCDPASGCVFTPNNADCDDGNLCTLVDTCKNGQCVGSMPTDCDDGNACTFDVCQKISGLCQHSKLTGTACDNGDACTVNDTCQNGACQAGKQTCECYVTADCAGKEDGDLCNGTLVCDTNAMPHLCALDPTTIITCPTTSDTVCLKNTCQPASGKCEMTAVNESGSCDDGNPCTGDDACKSGDCAGTPKPTGTTIFSDDFNDGNWDSWEAKGWKTCSNCEECKPQMVQDGQNWWIWLAPLGSATFCQLTTPPLDLPPKGQIQFLFSNPQIQMGIDPWGNPIYCGAGNCTIKIVLPETEVVVGNPPSDPNQPPTKLSSLPFNIGSGAKGKVMIDCIGSSCGPSMACSQAEFDDFAVTCP